jgi:hypothetical protein
MYDLPLIMNAGGFFGRKHNKSQIIIERMSDITMEPA